MLRIQHDNNIDFKNELCNKDASQIIDFFSHINANLDKLASDSNNIVDRTKILKVKEFVSNITRLIETILKNREIPLLESEVRRFKKLIVNYVEKIVFKNIS